MRSLLKNHDPTLCISIGFCAWMAQATWAVEGYGRSTLVYASQAGCALNSGLMKSGGTECTAGGGLYLQNDSNRAILRNVHRTRGEITDKHITIRGGIFNGNRDRQRISVPLGQGGLCHPDWGTH